MNISSQDEDRSLPTPCVSSGGRLLDGPPGSLSRRSPSRADRALGEHWGDEAAVLQEASQ